MHRDWRHEHALHHASSGELDRRGKGDVWTLTVQEYLEASGWKRLGYRLARNPVVLFFLAPLCLFLIDHRFPRTGGRKRERASVYWTNAALLGVASAASLTVGLKTYLLVQVPVLMVAATVGVWLFYVQHQFEDAYWERGKDWDFVANRPERELVLPASRVLAVVHRKHRIPSRSSLEPGHSQLQPREMPPGAPDVPRGEAADAAIELEVSEASPLGRAAKKARLV